MLIKFKSASCWSQRQRPIWKHDDLIDYDDNDDGGGDSKVDDDDDANDDGDANADDDDDGYSRLLKSKEKAPVGLWPTGFSPPNIVRP